MYDVDFYRMLSEAEDAILRKSSVIEELKAHLEFVHDTDKERVRDEISEAYLAMQYATELRNGFAELLGKVKLLNMFVDCTVEDDVFNMLYEETMQD